LILTYSKEVVKLPEKEEGKEKENEKEEEEEEEGIKEQ